MFRHAIAAPYGASLVQDLVLRIKITDVRLWTNYFNSKAEERSLIKDYPRLQDLTIRYRGPRYNPLLTPEQNVVAWLKDSKLEEVIVSVRGSVSDTKVEICVRVPEDWRTAAWDTMVAKAVHERGEPLKRNKDYTYILGVWMKLETEGT